METATQVCRREIGNFVCMRRHTDNRHAMVHKDKAHWYEEEGFGGIPIERMKKAGMLPPLDINVYSNLDYEKPGLFPSRFTLAAIASLAALEVIGGYIAYRWFVG